MLLPFPTFQWLSISEQSLYYFLSKSFGIWRYCSIERGKMQIKNEGLRGILWKARPLIMDESSARMRNEGGGFAASVYGAMPERLLIAGFPFGIPYHRPPDRERKRFLAFARNDDTRESAVSQSPVTNHQPLKNGACAPFLYFSSAFSMASISA